MIRKTLVNVGVAALLGGMALAAQAATVNLNLTGYKWGTPHTVNASAPVWTGAAGSFTGTITNSAPGSLSLAVETYCLEITEFITLGVSTAYTKMDASDYFGSTRLGAFADAEKETKLAKLLSVANPQVQGGGGNADELSAALQLAIWNIRYDNDMTLTAGGSATFSDSSVHANQANIFLTAAAALQDNQIIYSVHVLSSGRPIGTAEGKQDQLIWERGGPGVGNPVPEPTSLALAFGALGALGFATRRRQTAKA